MDPNVRFEKNTNLVGFIYQQSFSEYSKYIDDIIQEGNAALWNCCLNFDENKNVQFSTYACVSIKRRMRKYIKNQIQKHSNDVSLETIIYSDGDNNDIKIEDCLCITEENFTKEMINECIRKLTHDEIKIISKIAEGYKQEEIGKMFEIPQQTVSKCLIKFKQILMKESVRDKTRNTVMKYTKKQSADILTLAYNYAEMNSTCLDKEGCYIVREESWRSVLSKGCNNNSESALKNATNKIRAKNVGQANGSTLFITKAPTEVNLIILYGIKTVIYGGAALPAKIQEELTKHSIETLHIENWKPNESSI